MKAVFLGLVVLVSTSVWAHDPERVPLKIIIPPEIESKLTQSERAFLETLKDTIQKEVFLWSNFEIEVPKPLFDPGVQIIEIAPFFNVDTQAHLRQLATGSDGERLRLSPEQWEQLRHESLFTVEDPRNPGQFDVWRVTSSLVHKGSKQITIDFQTHLANGLNHVEVQFPQALVGDHATSVRRGIRNVLYGIRNSLSLLVGLSETRPKYSASQIEERLDKERKRFAEFFHQFAGNKPPVLSDDVKLEKALPIVLELWKEHSARWERGEAARRNRLLAEVSTQWRAAPASVPQFVADELEKEKANEFHAALMGSPALQALDPDLSAELVSLGAALQRIRLGEWAIETEMRNYQVQMRAWYEQRHPIRSKDPQWLERQVRDASRGHYERVRYDRYETIVSDLRRAGLHFAADTLAANLTFFTVHAAELRKGIAGEREAARVFPQRHHRIWFPSNWILRVEKVDGKEIYLGEKYAPMPAVYTDTWGWRLLNGYQRTKAAFKNGLYWLVYENWWKGPVGAQALVRAEPFPNLYFVDPETGKILTDPDSKTPTLWSRLKEISESIEKTRERFEAAPDEGFLSKDFKRPFHAFWHGFVRRIFQPIVVGSFQVGATAANTAFAAAGALSAPVWAPMTGLFAGGFNAGVYDLDAPSATGAAWSADDAKQTGRLFPVFSQLLGRGAMAGLLPAAYAGLKAGLWHTSMALGHAGMGATRFMAESTRDALARLLFTLGGARIPAQDPSFVMARSQGLGVTNGFFYTVDRPSALTALLVGAFRDELATVQALYKDQIEAPERTARATLVPMEAVLFGQAEVALGKKSPILGPIEEQQKALLGQLNASVAEVSKGIQAWVPQAPAPIKVSREVLESVVTDGARLAELYYRLRVFPRLDENQIAHFWAQRKIAPDDWIALSQSLIAGVFGQSILQPVEDTEKSFEVHISPPRLLEQLEAVLSGEELQLDALPVPTWSAYFTQNPSPRIRTAEPEQLCRNMLLVVGDGLKALEEKFR